VKTDLNGGILVVKHYKQAAALRYDCDHDNAPRLVASGKRLFAEKIVSVARENNIPVVQDPGLVASLMKLEINTEIPSDLYLAVARILVFIHRLDRNHS